MVVYTAFMWSLGQVVCCGEQWVGSGQSFVTWFVYRGLSLEWGIVRGYILEFRWDRLGKLNGGWWI